MNAASRAAAAFMGLAAAWTACAPAKVPTTSPIAGGAGSVATANASASGTGAKTSLLGAPRARLAMIASDRWTARDAIDLGGGKRLLVGDGGERWLAEETGTADASVSKLTAAEGLAPEDLIGVRVTKDGGLVFVGRSGATFTAPKPLADLASRRLPPSPLRAVATGKRAIVGLGFDNTILRSIDDGATWSVVAVPKLSGALLQIALDHAGNGLVSAMPQRLLSTSDDGQTFAPIPSPGIGAVRLDVGKGDVVFVEGVALQVAKDGMVSMKSSPPAGVLRALPAPHLELVEPAPREVLRLPLPDDHLWLEYSGAATQGRGVLIGSRWLELVPDGSGDEKEKLLLVTADLAKSGALAAKQPIAGLDACLEQYLAGRDKILVAGCVHDADDGKAGLPHWTLRLARSDDSGGTWKDAGTVEWNPDAAARHLWVTSKGAVLIDGACLPPRDDQCGVGTTLVRAPGATKFVRVVLPPKTLEILRLVSSADGERVFALATEDGADELRLLVSRDGGKTFSAKPLPPLDDSAVEVADLAIEEDDGKTVSVTALVWGSAIVRFSTRDDGLTFEVTKTGLSPSSVALAGKRGLAIGEGNEGFETLDGGRTWGATALPRARDLGEWTGLVCSDDGCLIGERAFRIGWELASASDVKTASGSSKSSAKNVFATPIRCMTGGSTVALGAIEGIQPDPGSGLAWHAVRREGTKGAALVVQGLRTTSTSPKDVVREVTLFAPVAGEWATAVSSRAEGVTAIRYKLERDTSKPGKPGPLLKKVVDVEVAWWVAATNKTHHAIISGAGELDPYRYTVSEKDGSTRARASAWIASGGVYVRPFSAKGSEPFFFAAETGKITRLPAQSILPPLSLTALRTTTSTTFIAPTADGNGARQVFIGSLEHGATSWTHRWWAAWPRLEERTPDLLARVSATTIGKSGFVVIAWPGDLRVPAATWALPLDVLGNDAPEPRQLPTLKELGDEPHGCDATALGHPRIELPWSTGLRHPVIVKDGMKEFVLATADSIVRVDDKKPSCLSAWSATRAGGVGPETGVLFADDLAHAMLMTEKVDKGIRAVGASPMSCVYSKEPLPKALVSAKGFVEK